MLERPIRVLVLLLSFLLSTPVSAEEVVKARVLMGKIVEIKAHGEDRRYLLRAIDRAFEEMERLEALMSSYRPDSEVSLIEREAPLWVRVSPEVFDVLSKALEVSRLSDGAFDITVGILSKVWDFEKGKIPSRKDLETLLPLVDYRYLELKEGNLVRLRRRGVRLTLGGVAKGYIVDRAMDVLERMGVREALINAGGDVKAMGQRVWRIGIQHPRKEGSLLGILDLRSGAVATSGDYQRFFIREGKRYHHILDPDTGMPVEGLQSVTILAPEAWYADALATAVFVMGGDGGRRLIEGLEGVEGVLVDRDGRVWLSSGLKGKVELLR